MINDDIIGRSFNVLNLLGIIVCIITFCSIFIVSNYTLDSNIKNNHTYIVKGRINKIYNDGSLIIEHREYCVDPKYMIEPFINSDLIENNKVEIVVAESIFFNYIVKVNKIEKIN